MLTAFLLHFNFSIAVLPLHIPLKASESPSHFCPSRALLGLLRFEFIQIGTDGFVRASWGVTRPRGFTGAFASGCCALVGTGGGKRGEEEELLPVDKSSSDEPAVCSYSLKMKFGIDKGRFLHFLSLLQEARLFSVTQTNKPARNEKSPERSRSSLPPTSTQMHPAHCNRPVLKQMLTSPRTPRPRGSADVPFFRCGEQQMRAGGNLFFTPGILPRYQIKSRLCGRAYTCKEARKRPLWSLYTMQM